ncbi:hypothetical protein D0859_11774 [Hortaea werneckii]|uniref:Major facilitator superfamily (MFS) profile domain-containing protein n=1 Tax=Hortaea werneckii TaxID=91943 RepID=A0A3M7IFD2_HORWE|nr:hypothetical protein D0859_11774 [Hortaea werneckii]
MAETSSLDKNATELYEVRQSDDIEREAEAAHHIDRKDIHVSAHAELYREALERYPTDDSIDRVAEKKLVRKLDWRIIPLLGVCYFFYYVDKTTLSYAAIYGVKEDLNLKGDDYSWLSSICTSFDRLLRWSTAHMLTLISYISLLWMASMGELDTTLRNHDQVSLIVEQAIPSNLIMQRLPPAYYLGFNIFMWGALLMCEAAARKFAGLAALRVLSGAFEAIADPAFMLFVSTYYRQEQQPSRISAYYLWNGIGVAGGGLIGYGIGNIEGALASWRYEFIIVGAFCAAWGIIMWFALPNSPTTFWGFSHEEKLLMIARVRSNQTGVEQNRVNWGQIREAFLDYKTHLFLFFGFIANIPNGGISNFSTLVIQGLGYDELGTSLLGIPQGVIIVIWIVLGAVANHFAPKNSRTLVAGAFMLPTIAGGLGFLLAPDDAYVGRLICFYMTGSYQASFIMTLSLITSNVGGQSKKMIVSGIIWFGACVGNIASPFFYKEDQAPNYTEGIGSLLAANIIELLMCIVFRFVFAWENKRKEKQRAALRESGREIQASNETAFSDMTDKENPK